MNIAFPLLLLVFGGLTFWLLSESKLKWYFKVSCISSFCVFTIIFWLTTHTFLGWAAMEKNMPAMVNIHWVVIKEPNKTLNLDGGIYLLLESSEDKRTNPFLKFFGYKNSSTEPRLFKVTYSRRFHEQIDKEIMPKLKNGQIVRGKLLKGNATDENHFPKQNEMGKNSKKGGGSESQEQEWVFHNLRPSQIHQKPQ